MNEDEDDDDMPTSNGLGRYCLVLVGFIWSRLVSGGLGLFREAPAVSGGFKQLLMKRDGFGHLRGVGQAGSA